MSHALDPQETELEVEVRRKGKTVVVAPQGEVTVFTSPTLRARLQEVLAEAPRRVVLDLGAVGYVDSSGVATLVEALRRLRDQGGEMVLARVGRRVRGVIEIARLDTLFPMAETVEEACGE